MCFWLYYDTNKACLFECGALVSCWHYHLETSYLYVALTGVHCLHNVISLCSLVWLLASKNCVIHGASSLFLMSYLFVRYIWLSAFCIGFDAVGWAAGSASGLQKNWVMGCWNGYLSGARCRLAYGPADATATHCLLLQWNPDWFYLSVTSLPG